MSTERASLRACAVAAMCIAAILWPAAATAQGQVNIYSYRQPQLIDPLFKAFTAKTGIRTNVVFAPSGLNERLAAEGANTAADLLFTVDVGRLIETKHAGLTQPVMSPALKVVHAAFRDPDDQWFGFTLRSRIVYASKERVEQDSITYAELADPKWKVKICSRSGQHVYNTSLIATVIAHEGTETAEAWLRGLKATLAQKPAGGDREQVRDVHAGKCDLAIGNTYYMAAMLSNPDQRDWAQSVKLLFPDSAGRSSHVNISGVALTLLSKNRDNSIKLMEFLASDQGQSIYASVNNEYPVSPNVPVSDAVKSWGTLKPDTLPLSSIAKYRKQASEMVDHVGFDAEP